jgi:beta-glucanase (GH16 family)
MVAYLNGTEVARSNLPSGTISATTPASGEGTSESQLFTFDIPASRLRNGSNVLAVAVHQASKGSDDLSMDAQLKVNLRGGATTTTRPPSTTRAPSTTTRAPSTTQPATTTTSVVVPPSRQVALPPATGGAATTGTGDTTGVGPWTKLVFTDDFNGEALDTKVWSPYHSTYGEGNKELECLTPENITVKGGSLLITSKRQQATCPGNKQRNYTSGFMGSRETGHFFPREAYYEVRGKLPHAQGIWPAFWLRHHNGAGVAEIDIMEYFHSQIPGKTSQTLHLDHRLNLSKKVTPFEPTTDNPGWHTWGVSVEPGQGGWTITFYTDRKAVHTYTDTQANWARTGSTTEMFDIAVNTAVGGNWVGPPDGPLGELPDVGQCSEGGTYPGGCRTTGIRRWSGSEVYEVDYVRVWTRG